MDHALVTSTGQGLMFNYILTTQESPLYGDKKED